MSPEAYMAVFTGHHILPAGLEVSVQAVTEAGSTEEEEEEAITIVEPIKVEPIAGF